MIVKLDHETPGTVGVKIPKTFELPPPSNVRKALFLGIRGWQWGGLPSISRRGEFFDSVAT